MKKKIIYLALTILFLSSIYVFSSDQVGPGNDIGTKQDTGNAYLSTIAGDTTSIDGKVSTSANQVIGNTSLSTIEGDTTSIDNKIGEVQASPTENTVLDRLKNIASELQVNTVVNTANSTTTPLLGTASAPADVFTGTAIDLTPYVSGIVAVFADQNSATEGLDIQYSTDGTNWDHAGAHSYTITANEARGIEFGVEARYVRIMYTNGAVAQGAFRMQTLLSKKTVNLHVHAIEYVIDGSHPAPISRTILTAQRADTAYGNIGSTNGDNLKISLEELESGISSNSNTQLNVTLFGTTGISANIDSMSASLQIVDFEHHECHEGNCWFSSFGNDVSGAGEQTCIAFNTPASGPMIHMIFDASAGLEAFASIYENTSIDVDEGTEQNPFNRNRIDLTASIVTSIETTPVANTVTTYNETQAAGANITTTTEIFHEHIGVTGAPTTRSGGISRGRSEYILARSQQYAFCITAIDVNANHHNVRLNWYEHTDSNP